MSWEGYYQCFCTGGHYDEFHPSYVSEKQNCSICGEPYAVMNMVDDTNCNMVGVIPLRIIDTWVIEPEKHETCDLGHQHLVSEARYRIPTEEELKENQHYWSITKGELVPLKEVGRENVNTRK